MVTRVNTLRLLLNYDAVVDTDVRDRALDVLVPLLELDSPRMAIRLGKCSTNNTNSNNNTVVVRTRLYDALIPAITTTAGRTEAAAVAAQLLRELAQAGDEARPGLEYAQQRLVQVASRDPRVSQLVWKELHPVKQKDDNHDDDNDDDDDEEDDKDKAHGLNDSTWENGSSHENTGKGNEMVGDQKTDFEE